MLIKQEEGRTSAPLPRSTIAASKEKTPEEANVPRTYEVIDLTMDDDDEDDEDNDEDEDEESDGGGKESEDNEKNEGNEDDTDHEDTEDNGDNDSNGDDDDDNDDDNDARVTQCADVPIIDQAEAPTTATSIVSSPSPSLAPKRVLSIEPPPKSSLTKKRSRQGGGGVVDLITHLLAGGGDCGRMSKIRKPNQSKDGGEDSRIAAKKEPAKDSDRTEGPVKKRKKEKGKYRVTWKEDSLLEEVRLFHKSEEEIEGNGLGLSHQDEGAVLRRKKEALEWHDPIPLVLPPLVEEISWGKVAMAGEGFKFLDEEYLHFVADNPQEMDILREPEFRLGGEHTGLLTETAEIPWPDILLEGMEGIEYPEPMLDSPQQVLLPTLPLHRPLAPPPPSTSPSLPPPRLRPASPLTQEHRRTTSSEGRHQHESAWTDERRRPGNNQLRRQSTDAPYLTSSNKLPLPDRPGLRRYSMPERAQSRRTSPSNREHSRRSSPSNRSEREAEQVPIPERPQRQGGGEHSPPCEKSSWEKGKARYGQREDNEPGKRYRLQREEESEWEILRREERDSSKSYHYERRSWRYAEEREREEWHDWQNQRERKIEEVEEDRSFRRPSTGERGGTHGDRGGGSGGTTPPTPKIGRNDDVKVPRRHNSLSSHDRPGPGQHKRDEYGYGSKQSTYWNNNQDVTYPHRPYTRPDRESERRVGTKEKSEGARS